MKKLALFIAAGMMFFGAKLYAGESVSSPGGEVSNPINADYGGVEIATAAFTTIVTTVPSGVGPLGISYQGFFASTGMSGGPMAGTVGNTKTRWRVYGAVFSTGTCGTLDSIVVFTSTVGATGGSLREVTRFYNVYGSTQNSSNMGGSCSGLQFSRWPIRAYGNLFFQSSSAGYNQTQLLYWREPD